MVGGYHISHFDGDLTLDILRHGTIYRWLSNVGSATDFYLSPRFGCKRRNDHAVINFEAIRHIDLGKSDSKSPGVG